MARKKSRWNIGTIVFLVLLIYVLINVLIFVGKEKLTVYKVTEDKISSTYSLTGIALRNEKLLKAEDDGYITYYTEEGKGSKSPACFMFWTRTERSRKSLPIRWKK